MTITQIEVFLKVIQLNSFTRAGDELGMTQSAVSHSITNLENYFGTKLLIRSKSGVKLTTIGEKIFQNMIEIIKNVEFINSEISNVSSSEKRVLKLGGYTSRANNFHLKLSKMLQQIFPKIEIVFFEGYIDEIKEWLDKEIIDIGFITLPNKNYDTINLLQNELKIILPKNHLLANEKSLKLKEISNENFILYKGNEEMILRYISNYKDNQIKKKHVVSNIDTIFKMVEKGIGITILPSFILLNRNMENFAISSFNPSSYMKIGLASKEKFSDDPIKKAFVEKIKQILNIYYLSEISNKDI